MRHVYYIAGASGTGKSTRADQVSAELGSPVRVISTDIIRAQLRAAMPESSHPELWAESFNVPASNGDVVDSTGFNPAGFLRQCAPILRCVEAGVTYALAEGWSCVVEGVHLVPGHFDVAAPSDVSRTCELRVVYDRQQHRDMFSSRARASDDRRPAQHYHDHLDQIHLVQRLLDQAWESWSPEATVSRCRVEVAASS